LNRPAHCGIESKSSLGSIYSSTNALVRRFAYTPRGMLACGIKARTSLKKGHKYVLQSSL
jgi:hypothetical protein